MTILIGGGGMTDALFWLIIGGQCTHVIMTLLREEYWLFIIGVLFWPIGAVNGLFILIGSLF